MPDNWTKDDTNPFTQYIMPDDDIPNDTRFMYRQLEQDGGDEYAARAYAGDVNDYEGIGGVIHALMELADTAVSESLSEGDDYPRAFNNATSRWTREARTLFAAHQVATRDEDSVNDTEYLRNLEDYANQGGHIPYEENVQTELSCYYNRNIRDEDSLTREERETVIEIRMVDPDADESLVEDVVDHNEYRACLDETGDAQMALTAHYFGSGLPRRIRQNLAPVEAWPDDELDGSLYSRQCDHCASTLYEAIVDGREDDGMVWLADDGNVLSLHDWNRPGRDRIYEARALHSDATPSSEAGQICSRCYRDMASAHTEIAITTGDGRLYRIGRHSSLVFDHGNDDTVYDPLISMDAWGGCENIFDRDDTVRLSASDGPRSTTDCERALSAIVESPEDTLPTDVPLIVIQRNDFRGAGHFIEFPRDNPDAARAAKEILENPVDAVEVSA